MADGEALLAELGFEASADLTLTEGEDGVELSVYKHSRERGVYALKIDGEIMYVGETGLELYRRIYFYKRPEASQQTNLRIHELLSEHLPTAIKNKCEIWFLPDDRIVRGKVVLQLHGSLLETAPDRSIVERILISHLQPPWNRS